MRAQRSRCCGAQPTTPVVCRFPPTRFRSSARTERTTALLSPPDRATWARAGPAVAMARSAPRQLHSPLSRQLSLADIQVLQSVLRGYPWDEPLSLAHFEATG